jgi:MFS family permease
MATHRHDNTETRVIWLASGSHFMTHGFMTLFSAVMVVIAGENSMSFMAIGIIANVGYFLYGLGGIPAGYLADRMGAKQVLTIGVFGMSISSLLVGLSFGMWPFAITYALLGLFSSIHHPAGLSFIARGVGSQRGKAMGVHGVMGNIGMFATPMVAAGCIWLFHSWRAAYLLYGVLGLLFSVILHRTKVPGEPDFSFQAFARLRRQAPAGQPAGGDQGALSGATEEAGGSLVPIAMLLLLLGSTLSGFIFRGSLTFLPTLFIQEVRFITNYDYPVVMAGYVATAVLSFGLIGAWFGGYINDKIKRPELFPAVVFAIVTPLFYLISKYTDNKLLAVSCLFSLVYYAWQPCQNYLIAKYTTKAFHGMGFGINFFLLFGIGSVATSVGGYITDKMGVDRFYALMAFIAVIALLVSLLVYVCRGYQLRIARSQGRLSWKLEERR